jgi:ATP phosphoribosyltransferase
MSKKLKFGLPKGSLQDATIEKLAKAGYHIQVSSRSYVPYVDDDELEIRLIRAQEISRYVEHGYLDCGITGHDWIMENASKVHEVGEFIFSKVSRRPARWVLCVPENSPGQTHRHRSRSPHEKISEEKRREGGSGIFLGRDGSEGARTRGRHRGSDRDRRVAQSEQAAHRG